MAYQLDFVEYLNWSLENPMPIKSGMAFYEIQIPHKYMEFDRIYIFSNINPEATAGRVYFQSASTKLKNANPDDYKTATARNVPYDGFGQAISSKSISTLCICDPGIFIQGKITSWYGVMDGVDICSYIAKFLSYWFEAASLKASEILIFGSSAGSFGALRTASFLENKTNVIAVNAQIKRKFSYKNIIYEHDLMSHYQQSLQQNRVIPNIYLLCNYRDKNTVLNRQFFNLITNYSYNQESTYRPNIVLDIYDGLSGHLRPRRDNLLQKINIAETLLKSSQEEQNFQRQQEELDKKIAKYQRAIKVQPEQSSFYRSLGKYQQEKGDIESAISSYRQAIELNSNQPAWVYRNLGKALRCHNHADEAMRVYQQAIELRPDNPSFYRGLANLQSDKGDVAIAIANYRKAIELNPEQPAWVYQHLDKALGQQEQIKEVMAV